MDPQQELFTALRGAIKKLGYDVYDGFLPSKSTPYPFVYLADNQMLDDRAYKNAVLGDITQTVHVWHNNVRQRGTVSNMLFEIKKVACKITETTSYSWNLTGIDQRILNDDTTDEPLMHGLLTLDYKLVGVKEEELSK